MTLLTDYVTYLKDNPHGYWFKRKLYGWGWVPTRVEGWITIILYIVGVIYFATKAESVVPNTLPTLQDIAPIIILTVILIAICYLKGEKPKWQWGLPKVDDEK